MCEYIRLKLKATEKLSYCYTRKGNKEKIEILKKEAEILNKEAERYCGA
jgi:hypothetical protein